MKKATPIALLLTAALIWTGCTPSGSGNAGTPGNAPGPENSEKITDQEKFLESVGLKFLITSSVQGDQELTSVTWDPELRQAWIDEHSSSDLQLQVQALEDFITFAEALETELEAADQEPTDATLHAKLILSKQTLKEF
jgi:hypothetical protein